MQSTRFLVGCRKEAQPVLIAGVINKDRFLPDIFDHAVLFTAEVNDMLHNLRLTLINLCKDSLKMYVVRRYAALYGISVFISHIIQHLDDIICKGIVVCFDTLLLFLHFGAYDIRLLIKLITYNFPKSLRSAECLHERNIAIGQSRRSLYIIVDSKVILQFIDSFAIISGKPVALKRQEDRKAPESPIRGIKSDIIIGVLLHGNETVVCIQPVIVFGGLYEISYGFRRGLNFTAKFIPELSAEGIEIYDPRTCIAEADRLLRCLKYFDIACCFKFATGSHLVDQLGSQIIQCRIQAFKICLIEAYHGHGGLNLELVIIVNIIRYQFVADVPDSKIYILRRI